MTLDQIKQFIATNPNHPLAIKFKGGQGVEHGGLLGNTLPQPDEFIRKIGERPKPPQVPTQVPTQVPPQVRTNPFKYGSAGGMGTLGGGTPLPMNLGQGTGDPRMYPQLPQTQAQTQVPPQVPQNPERGFDDPRVMSMIGKAPNFGDNTSGRSMAFEPFSGTPLPINPTPIQPQRPMVQPSNAQPRNITTDPNVVERNFMGMPQGGKDGRFGMTGYFDRLFNNPARMAMLQGGLSAMDPSSYYDKEGFSSPWTGLRSGLGGAQAGYKSVIDRRKEEAATALAKAKTAAEGQGGAYSTVDIGPNMRQMQKDGKLVGKAWKKPKKYALGSTESEIFAIDLFNPNDNIKIKEKLKNLTPLQQKEANHETQMAELKLDEIDEFEKLITRSYLSGSEIPGTAMDVWNTITENFFDTTTFEDRAAIKSAIQRLTPMLTSEYVREAKISDQERAMVKKALGYSGLSSARDKIRAIPAIKKLLRLKAGRLREPDATGEITDKKAAFKKANPEMFDEQGNPKF
jgi:hypothetical protein